MNYFAIVVVAIGIVAAIMIFRKLSRVVSNSREEAEDSDGQEVFVGPAQEAGEVVHTLANAGIIAWTEPTSDGETRVFVEDNQKDQVPALLAVQQHMEKEQQNQESAGPVSAPAV